ncbi:MAG: general secretion pathway protein GspB [Candidatus Omnitrophica bacterium]|nr:general secretion pathway protein GspB [Candidatus Omnitrophota bacterium]
MKFVIITLFMPAFIFNFFISSVFATQADEYQKIKKLQEMEEQPSVEMITRPYIEYRAESEGIRDPFRGLDQTLTSEGTTMLPVENQEPLPTLTVQGIVWGARFPQAIINNKVVKAGDTIEGKVKIVNIDKEGVMVIFNGRQYNLAAPAAGYSSDNKSKEDSNEKNF